MLDSIFWSPNYFSFKAQLITFHLRPRELKSVQPFQRYDFLKKVIFAKIVKNGHFWNHPNTARTTLVAKQKNTGLIISAKEPPEQIWAKSEHFWFWSCCYSVEFKHNNGKGPKTKCKQTVYPAHVTWRFHNAWAGWTDCLHFGFGPFTLFCLK